MIAHCASCERVHHYPRVICPYCWSDDVEQVAASGRATLYTYSRVFVNDLPPFSSRLPYVAAMVELEEGPRMMSTVVDCEPDELEIGMALVARFTPLSDELDAVVFAKP
jgi:uncharacterized OB-fold protein